MLQAKAAAYLRNRRLKYIALGKATIAVSKTGKIIDPALFEEPATGLASNQMLVDVVKDQRKVFYKGLHISVSSRLAGCQYYRRVTDEEFFLSDPDTGEVVMSFPLPLTAVYRSGKFIPSYAIRGIPGRATGHQRTPVR